MAQKHSYQQFTVRNLCYKKDTKDPGSYLKDFCPFFSRNFFLFFFLARGTLRLLAFLSPAFSFGLFFSPSTHPSAGPVEMKRTVNRWFKKIQLKG